VATPLGAGTVVPASLNGRGFYLDGHTGAVPFSSTVTVTLSSDLNGAKFNWCAYATDYPPNATIGAGEKKVYIYNNPRSGGTGTSGCDRSIAVGKGWTVNDTAIANERE
jgi:hypothetical protein